MYTYSLYQSHSHIHLLSLPVSVSLTRTHFLSLSYTHIFSLLPLLFSPFTLSRRVFELQVQGQFKRLPIGEIVVGGESTNKMELGLIMRSVCKAVCNFGSSIINDLHFSFGDLQSNFDYQLPHMAAPLFTTMDRVIVSLDKSSVPKMGEPFIEDPEYRKKRMKFKNIDDANIKLEHIYSFSVASSNIDFCKWCTVGIPMVRPMDLRTIWGDSDLSLGTYVLFFFFFSLVCCNYLNSFFFI